LRKPSRENVIVFAPFRHSIDTIHTHLLKNNIAAEVIHGDVSVGKRTDIFKRFQTLPDPRILVIQPQAASHGVTLTAADTVAIIFFGPVMPRLKRIDNVLLEQIVSGKLSN